MTVKKNAMISYNSILLDRGNGWITDSLYLIQNNNGKTWFEQEVEERIRDSSGGRQRIKDVKNTIYDYWKKFGENMNEFDKVFIYIGANGSEIAIEYAVQCGLLPEKACFVMCHCNSIEKKDLLKKYGFDQSQIIYSDCSGRETMARLAHAFLKTGDLHPLF